MDINKVGISNVSVSKLHGDGGYVRPNPGKGETQEAIYTKLYKELQNKGLMFDGKNTETIEVKKSTKQIGIEFPELPLPSGLKTNLVKCPEELPVTNPKGDLIPMDDGSYKRFYLININTPFVQEGKEYEYVFSTRGVKKTITVKIEKASSTN